MQEELRCDNPYFLLSKHQKKSVTQLARYRMSEEVFRHPRRVFLGANCAEHVRRRVARAHSAHAGSAIDTEFSDAISFTNT